MAANIGIFCLQLSVSIFCLQLSVSISVSISVLPRLKDKILSKFYKKNHFRYNCRNFRLSRKCTNSLRSLHWESLPVHQVDWAEPQTCITWGMKKSIHETQTRNEDGISIRPASRSQTHTEKLIIMRLDYRGNIGHRCCCNHSCTSLQPRSNSQVCIVS